MSVNDKYPLISVRISPAQKEYLVRESKEKAMSVADYVRTVLFPFELPDGK